MDSSFPSSRDPISVADNWTCKQCGTVNKGYDRECKACAHEPVMGRMDYEARRWAESHKQED